MALLEEQLIAGGLSDLTKYEVSLVNACLNKQAGTPNQRNALARIIMDLKAKNRPVHAQLQKKLILLGSTIGLHIQI